MRVKIPASCKPLVHRWLWPLMPGWPDEGRRIVQGPHLRELLGCAAERAGCFRRVFNAGSGEGGYSPLLLALPGVEAVLESDFSYGSHPPTRVDRKQAFFGASLTSIPLANASVDLILCTEVLEHIEQDQEALDEIARVMTPSAWLLITVPTPPAPYDPAHVREGYRPDDLTRMLAERGFAIAETRFCMHFFFRWLLGKWARLPWSPRILIRTIAGLDRLLPLGPPMDLMILAYRQAP